MLSEELKKEIQLSYSNWLGAREFKARRGQREMVAHIARTIAGEAPRIAVVEAGTGTGKTAAYCIAAIPIAKKLGKTVVISTATVALQEQVTLRDLPDLMSHAELKFDYAIAKGRGRYLCLKRLDDRLKYTDQQEIPLFESGSEIDADANMATYQEMLSTFGVGSWDGELDSWSAGVEPEVWRPVTTDHRGCTNKRCSYFRQCPFFKARTKLDGVDVIVANHDLVLADLSLGGGAVLPEPEDCIFVIDEAHHLPAKTQQHFSVSTRVRSNRTWVEQVNNVVGSLTQRFSRPPELVKLAALMSEYSVGFSAAMGHLEEALEDLDYVNRDETLETHRFVLGEIPENLADLSRQAATPIAAISQCLDGVHELLQKALDGEVTWKQAYEAEDWLPVVGQHETRAQATTALLEDFGGLNKGQVLHARWINRYDSDCEMVSAPIEPGRLLANSLWQNCYAAVCTSATLTAMGRFERFFERAGIEDLSGLRIPSPFNFPEIASLVIPNMESDPRDFDAHSDEVAKLLPQILKDDPSGLVLFTSWRQLNAVIRMLPGAFLERLKVQGEGSKQALIIAHEKDVDAGTPSVLVGLASFSEGVDLPDDYCRHVVIVKLPFSVPDDPIDQAMAEYAESQGRNAFYEISVPDAALKLVQACGRLIRHETDYGRITLLDKRIVTQRYGRALLESLPPYRLEVESARHSAS